MFAAHKKSTPDTWLAFSKGVSPHTHTPIPRTSHKDPFQVPAILTSSLPENLHLTPVSSVVHLRPVPHHIDALTEQERLSRGASGAGAGGSDKADTATGARAIHMTIKSAMDGDGGVATETIADRLRKVQMEPWRRMEWVHDEAELAWEAYNECLLLRPSAEGAAGGEKEAVGDEAVDGTTGGEKDVKSKGKEVAGSGTVDGGAADLVDRVPHLKTDWGEKELLQAMSGEKPKKRGTGR